jgi:hypothetical protein
MPIFGRHINKTKAIPLVAKRVIEFNNARNIGDTALNSAERAMSESLLDGFSMIRPEEFEKLVNNIYYTGYEKEVERAFSVIESELASELHKQLVESAKAEAKELSQQFISALTKAELPTPAEITMAFSFNAQSPEALKWARDESSKLVTNMKKDQLAVVRRVVGQSFGAGETRAGTSKNLRAILSQVSPGTDAGKLMARTLGVNANGLTVRYEQALFNRATQVANTLTAQGIEGTKALEKIKTDTNKYAEKLRRQRARTIARTETMMAYNEGKQQAWNQAADRGLINKQTARKVWVTGPMDVCTICAPLNGQNQPINKPFSIKKMTPPAHPNCRCTMVLNASPKGRPTQGLGTGTPGDPYRVSVPDVPNLDDFPALPNVDAGDVVSAPRPTTPAEGFSVERRVVSGEDIEFHVHSDGRVQVPGTDIERDPTGRWFRNDKNGVREEFIPSRNSAAGKIERGVKGGVPTPPKPVVPEPTPPIVPEPVVVVPEPPVKPSLLDRQEFDRDGKVPAFRINSDGTIQLPDTYHNGSPIRRTADGKWERIAEPNGNYYTEFTPSQNSAAGQLERHLKRNKFKPGEEFKPTGVRPPKPVAPEPKPVVPEPTPIPAPASQYVPPSGDVVGFEISREGIVVLEGEQYLGQPILRLNDGRWVRANRNTGMMEEFVPLRGSSAFRVEENLKQHNFKVGEMFQRPDMKLPTVQTPTGLSPTAGPLSGARPDLVVDIEDLRDDIALISKSGAKSRSTSDWIGWDEHPNDTAAMDAIDKAGGRVLAKIEQEVRRLDPTAQDDIRAIDKLIDEAKYELDKLALNMTSEYRKAWTSILDRITSDAVSHRTKALMSYVDLPAQDEIANTLLVFDEKSRKALLEAIVEEGDTSAGRLLAQLLRVDYFGGEKTWARIIDDLAGVGDIRLSSTRFDEFAKVPELNEAIERWRQAMDARGKVNDKVLQLRADKGKIAKRVVDIHNAVLKDVLRASRPRYGQPRASIASYFRDVKLPTGVKKKDWADAIEELDGMLPAEWVEDTITQTRGSGWTLKFTKRGYNSSRERTIALSGDKTNSGKGIRGWRSTLAHEFQHSVQDVRGVTNSEYLIINRLGKKRGLTSSSKPKTITKGEVGWDLGVNDLYTGRLYTWGSTEVTTRGVERLFYEGWAGMRKNGDEYIRYLLGILVGL